jgi:hypothetical protein
MSWIKEKIGGLRAGLGLGNTHPYCLWNPHLFERVDPAAVERCIDQRFILLQLFAGTWERVERTAAVWCNAEGLSAVQISRQLSFLYLCQVYPRATLLADLRSRLEAGSREAQLCLFYGSKESDTRHIRNALAHGSFTHRGNDIEFFDDGGWSRTLTTQQLELDSLVILDLIFSAGARAKTVVADAYSGRRKR